MNIRHISNNLRRLVMEIEQDKSMQRRGLHPYRQHNSNELIRIMTRHVVEPIIKDLCNATGLCISFQHGTSTGFYYLMAKGMKFAILHMPNPANGVILITPLNRHGKQCAPSEPLKDTFRIVDYLNKFNS